MNSNEDLDPRLEKKFKAFQKTAAGGDLAAGRAAFLAEAQQIARVVTPQQKRRHNRWIENLRNLFSTRKEKSAMPGIVATIILITALLFGGGGVTVAAAQSSLPDQPLYGVKTLSEDVRLALTTDPQAAYQLALDLATRRSEEIGQMVEEGKTPPDDVQVRYQNEVEEAARLASGLPTEQAVQALGQVILRLQMQQQALQQLQTQANPQAEAARLRSRQMLIEHLQQVQAGLADPARFHDQLPPKGNPHRPGADQTPAPPGQETREAKPPKDKGNLTGTPENPPDKGNGNCPNCTPGSNKPGQKGKEGNPWLTDTPFPCPGYDPSSGLDINTVCPPGLQPEGQPPQDNPGQDGKGGKN
jgi:hypothetical protein